MTQELNNFIGIDDAVNELNNTISILTILKQELKNFKDVFNTSDIPNSIIVSKSCLVENKEAYLPLYIYFHARYFCLEPYGDISTAYDVEEQLGDSFLLDKLNNYLSMVECYDNGYFSIDPEIHIINKEYYVLIEYSEMDANMIVFKEFINALYAYSTGAAIYD